MDVDIDKINLKLLYVLDQDGPLRQHELAEHVPRSVQAVGQRLQGLRRDGLVDPEIVEPDNPDAHAEAIAYQVTEAGRQMLQQYLVCAEVDCPAAQTESAHQHRFEPAADFFESGSPWN